MSKEKLLRILSYYTDRLNLINSPDPSEYERGVKLMCEFIVQDLTNSLEVDYD